MTERDTDTLLGRLAEAVDPSDKAVLVAGPGATRARDIIAPEAVVWVWEAGQPMTPTLEPPDGPFDLAILGLSRDRDLSRMAIAMIAARQAADGVLLLHGANEDGIRSADALLRDRFDSVETLVTKAHGRVWRTQGPLAGTNDASAAAWRRVAPLDGFAGTPAWVSYPGTFAKGGLDAGTALLLGHLGPIEPSAEALDFAAGTGPIARALVERGAKVTMIEANAFALAAARENVPEAIALLGTDLDAARDRRFRLIASNPPLHDGHRMDFAVLRRLIDGAPSVLRPDGRLLLVTLRGAPVAEGAADRFRAVDVVAEAGAYRVWSLGAPKRELAKPRRR